MAMKVWSMVASNEDPRKMTPDLSMSGLAWALFGMATNPPYSFSVRCAKECTGDESAR